MYVERVILDDVMQCAPLIVALAHPTNSGDLPVGEDHENQRPPFVVKRRAYVHKNSVPKLVQDRVVLDS